MCQGLATTNWCCSPVVLKNTQQSDLGCRSTRRPAQINLNGRYRPHDEVYPNGTYGWTSDAKGDASIWAASVFSSLGVGCCHGVMTWTTFP